MYASANFGVPARGAPTMTLSVGEVAVLREERDTHLPLFTDVYELYFDEVARWARAMGAPQAELEDVCQDVFLVVRRRLREFDGTNIKGWLYRITQRTVRSYLRRAWIKRALFIGDDRFALFKASGDDPEEYINQRQRGEMLERALSRMSQRKRTALILHIVEGKSGEEIAELEGVPVGTVYTRIYHAKRELTAALRRELSK